LIGNGVVVAVLANEVGRAMTLEVPRVPEAGGVTRAATAVTVEEVDRKAVLMSKRNVGEET
jgi:hypothetical protein